MPKYHSRVVVIDPPQDGEVVLTLQVANFLHAKGGMREPIRLVAESGVATVKNAALIKDGLVFGCLLIMSIYHLALFIYRPTDRSNLYFALCCFLFGIRAGLTGEVFLANLFPEADWRITVRLEWLCAYTGGPLGLAYIHSLFPGECDRRYTLGALVLAAVMSAVTLMGPIPVFTSLFPYLMPLTGLILCYGMWVLFRATLRRRYGATLTLVSMAVVIGFVVNDILYTNVLVQTGHYIPYGMLLFVFSQAMILSYRSARTFHQLETTNLAFASEIQERKRAESEVITYQERLEELVRQRTEDLDTANQRLRQELDEREAAEAEKLKLQGQLQRTQKMEALGTLAGGVAHDLNNILSGVVGYPDLLLQDLPPSSRLRKLLVTIQQSGQKAAAIVQDLLTLDRGGVAEFSVLDLNRIWP